MSKRVRSWAEIKRSKVADVRAYYFELTGQTESSPATKAGLIEEIEGIVRERAARTTELMRRRDTQEEARKLADWQRENAAATAQINAVFDTFPPCIPL